MQGAEVSLDGLWEFRRDDESTWQRIVVPGSWEHAVLDVTWSGVGWYRQRVHIPHAFSGNAVWLVFGAVSYHCRVFVDEVEVGQHTGMWDSFAYDISTHVMPGTSVTVMLAVEKPASLTAGPDSPPVAGRFPLRTTLSGFLPYVWGHAFGGIWQRVSLVATSATHIESVSVQGDADGAARIHIHTNLPTSGTWQICDADDHVRAHGTFHDTQHADITTYVVDVRTWSPQTPVQYTLHVSLAAGATHRVRFGFRTLTVHGTQLRLNGNPFYPRMVLSWGWYPDRHTPTPSVAQIRADFAQLQAMGFNGVKVCLWVPPAEYLDIADEMGMVIWLELPMWLPQPTAEFDAQTTHEYTAIVTQVRHHASVLLYTIGCELNRRVRGDILQALYLLVKRLVPGALVRDNSGSGEAYGGLIEEYADFYDYHFYSEPHFFPLMVERFLPQWRTTQPWLFGEYADYDTLRLPMDPDADTTPWWGQASRLVNPQGARWQMDVAQHYQRAQRQGLLAQLPGWIQLSHAHGMLMRQMLIEQTRLYPHISGYVITGERDTPISTAGMLDDTGAPKFAATRWRQWNDDMVVLLAWDRQREWVHGGDRPAYRETYSYLGGQVLRTHVVLANHTVHAGNAQIKWALTNEQLRTTVARGEGTTRTPVSAGSVSGIHKLEIQLPHVAQPCELHLTVQVTLADVIVQNSWEFYVFPSVMWMDATPLACYDPRGEASPLPEWIVPITDFRRMKNVVLAMQWDEQVAAYVRDGGQVVLVCTNHQQPAPVVLQHAPFWREALRVVTDHPAWGNFPHHGWAGRQFASMATDVVIADHHLPLLRRLDTRTMEATAYAVEMELGRGRLLVTTLRVSGGAGMQPRGIAANPAAQHMLVQWVHAMTHA